VDLKEIDALKERLRQYTPNSRIKYREWDMYIRDRAVVSVAVEPHEEKTDGYIIAEYMTGCGVSLFPIPLERECALKVMERAPDDGGDIAHRYLNITIEETRAQTHRNNQEWRSADCSFDVINNNTIFGLF